jgi:hypothetical protein
MRSKRRPEITGADRDCASAFLTRVAARGVRVWLIGSCLKLHGKDFRDVLTDEDRDIVRRYRHAIVAVLLDRGETFPDSPQQWRQVRTVEGARNRAARMQVLES